MCKATVVAATGVAAVLTIVGIVTNLLIKSGGGVPEGVRLVFIMAGFAWVCASVLAGARLIAGVLLKILRELRSHGVSLASVARSSEVNSTMESLDVLKDTDARPVSHIRQVTPLRPAR